MIRMDRKLNATNALNALMDFFILRSPREYIRSDNGPECIVQKPRDRITAVGTKTAFMEPGALWQNGYRESFHGRFRDELLKSAPFSNLREPHILIEQGRRHDNTVRPHSA